MMVENGWLRWLLHGLTGKDTWREPAYPKFAPISGKTFRRILVFKDGEI
jgi:hypothetical protein